MSPTPSRPRWWPALAWLLAAPLLWLAAGAVDRRTEVVVENLGDHLRIVVAGTELEVPAAIQRLDRVALHAAASIDPPGGRAVVLAHGSARPAGKVAGTESAGDGTHGSRDPRHMTRNPKPEASDSRRAAGPTP